MERCFRDMIWMWQIEFELHNGWEDMQTVYKIGQNHVTSTKAKEFVDGMERRFREQVSQCFVKDENGLTLFGWMCENMKVSDSIKNQAEEFMEKGRREYEQEFYEVYQNVGSIFAQHHKSNWKMLKNQVIMPYFKA